MTSQPKPDNYIEHFKFINLTSWVCKIIADLIGTGFICILNQKKEIYLATALHIFFKTPIDFSNSEYKKKIIDTLNGMLDKIQVRISSSMIKYENANMENSREYEDFYIKDLIFDLKLNNQNMITPKKDFIMFKIKSYIKVTPKGKKYSCEVNLEKPGLEIDFKCLAVNGPALVIQFPGSFTKIKCDANENEFQLGFDMGTIKVDRNDEKLNKDGLLSYDASTICGSSGSPVIQFFDGIPRVVGIHHGYYGINTNYFSVVKEGTPSTTNKESDNYICFSDIVVELRNLDKNTDLNDNDELANLDKITDSNNDEELANLANDVGFTLNWYSNTTSPEGLREDRGGYSPIFPKYLYDEAIASFVKITGVKDQSKIITGAIVNINSKKYLVISNSLNIESSDLENATLQFANNNKVRWSSIKSETDNNVYKLLEPVQLLPITDQSSVLNEFTILGVDVKQNHPYPSRIGSILIGCRNDTKYSFAFQSVHNFDWNNETDEKYCDQFSAHTVGLQVDNDGAIQWPCTSLSCLFQVCFKDPQERHHQTLKLVGFADKTEQSGTNYFGFGTGCPKLLDSQCKQRIEQNIQNYFCKIYNGNFEELSFRGLLCMCKLPSGKISGILTPYSENLKNMANTDIVNLHYQIGASKKVVLRQPFIVFPKNKTFCFIFTPNIPDPLLTIELSQESYDYPLLYFFKKDSENYEIQEIKYREVFDSGDLKCFLNKKDELNNIEPFIFNKNENIVGILLPDKPDEFLEEEYYKKFNKYKCVLIEDIIGMTFIELSKTKNKLLDAFTSEFETKLKLPKQKQ